MMLFKALLGLLVIQADTGVCFLLNVAIKKKAFTNSREKSNPKFAIDQLAGSVFLCSTWFGIDLKTIYRIRSIILTVTADGPIRFSPILGMTKYRPVDRSSSMLVKCGEYNRKEMNATFQEIKCPYTIKGEYRYIMFQVPHENIDVYKINNMKVLSDVSISTMNVAFKQRVFSNLGLRDIVLSSLVDGSPDATYTIRSMQVPKFVLDLVETYQLNFVKITFKASTVLTFRQYVQSYLISVGDIFDYISLKTSSFIGKPCATVKEPILTNEKYMCPMAGRFVMIEGVKPKGKEAFTFLSISEIRVFVKFMHYDKDYVGCFQRSVDLKAVSSVNQVEECVMACRYLYMPFALITKRKFCSCAKDVGSTRSDHDKCQLTCLRDPQPCGGSPHFSVYSTRLPQIRQMKLVACKVYRMADEREDKLPMGLLLTKEHCFDYCNSLGYKYFTGHVNTCVCTSSYNYGPAVECPKCLGENGLWCDKGTISPIYKACTVIGSTWNTCEVEQTYHCLKHIPSQVERFCGGFCDVSFKGLLCNIRRCQVKKGGCVNSQGCKSSMVGVVELSECLDTTKASKASAATTTLGILAGQTQSIVDLGRLSTATMADYTFYACSGGFSLNNVSKCVDINECTFPFACKGSKMCHNTQGSYVCMEQKKFAITKWLLAAVAVTIIFIGIFYARKIIKIYKGFSY